MLQMFCLSQAARRYCPHHVGHYLGMDVHDTPELSRSQPLQPGMAITIEPGKTHFSLFALGVWCSQKSVNIFKMMACLTCLALISPHYKATKYDTLSPNRNHRVVHL